jgi:hypothetical protein
MIAARDCDRALDRAVLRTQPPGQNAHDVEREMRRAADQKQKLLLGDRDELHVARRNRGGAARRRIDQRHLAENVVVGQRAEQPIAEADVDLAALNDEKLRRRIAQLENDLAGLEFAQRRAGPRQNAEIDGRLGHVAPPSLLQCRLRLLQFRDGGRSQFSEVVCGFARILYADFTAPISRAT